MATPRLRKPFLGQPNYLGAMQTGLSNRLAYDKANRVRSGVSARSSNTGPQSTSAGPIGSPAERAERRKNVLAEKAATEQVEQLGIDTKKKAADAKKAEYDTTAKGIENAVKFAPQLTKENYGDWFNWSVKESGFLPEGMFTSPEAVDKFTPGQFESYKKKLGELKSPDEKAVKYAIEEYKAETKRRADAAKNALLERKVEVAEEQARIAGEKFDVLQAEKDEKIKIEKEKAALAEKKFNEMSADQKSRVSMKQMDKLVEYESAITGVYEEGDLAAADIQGTKGKVEAFNRLAEKLGLDERYELGEIPAPIWGNKNKTVPGYVKVSTGIVTKPIPERKMPKFPTNILTRKAPLSTEMLEQYKKMYPGKTEEEIKEAYNRSL